MNVLKMKQYVSSTTCCVILSEQQQKNKHILFFFLNQFHYSVNIWENESYNCCAFDK